MSDEQQHSTLPVIALVSGPWGSGTSALCAMLNALGVHAQGPFFETNDPLTPACFEMLAFNKLVNRLVHEPTLQRKQPSDVIKQELISFRNEYFSDITNQQAEIQLLKTPASSALLPDLAQIFRLKHVIVLRDFESIERSRLRRKWPEYLGKAGAEIIYRQLVDFTARSNTPTLFVRHRHIVTPNSCEKLTTTLARFFSINPDEQQYKAALKSVAR